MKYLFKVFRKIILGEQREIKLAYELAEIIKIYSNDISGTTNTVVGDLLPLDSQGDPAPDGNIESKWDLDITWTCIPDTYDSG